MNLSYYIRSPRKLLLRLGRNSFLKLMSDRKYIELIWKDRMGYAIDLDNPKTFNEKLQWIKLNDRRPIYSSMVDKYEAKKYVASIIGEEYIIPTLGVWDSFDEIDFGQLPQQFVLKCTHDSGGLVICKNKDELNIEEARKKINKSLHTNYYWLGREWPYKSVKPRIIAEKYMEDETGELTDYKIHSFEEIPRVILVCRNRYSELGLTEDFFDENWEHISVKRPNHENADYGIEKPQELQEMLDLAERLSTQFHFLRTDFYTVNHKVFFGELTLFPASGLNRFEPQSIDISFGKWIKLPEVSGGGGYLLVHNNIILLLSEDNNENRHQLTDYKFYTMNGKVKMMMLNTDRGRNTKADYYDRDFNHLDFTWGYPNSRKKHMKPVNYEKMIKFAEQLSLGTTEVRVDFYESDGKLYFGELTFFDGSGLQAILPKEWDYKIGEWLEL